jgi:hypothetical protein
MRYISPDFGNTIANLSQFGAVADPSAGGGSGSGDTFTQMPSDGSGGGTAATPTGANTATQAAPASADQSGGCSKGMCDAMGAATSAALTALGPKAQPIPPATMAALASDKSAAGQAQYNAALAQNQQVAAQNAQRAAIISQFVKNAVGTNVTPAQMKLGDAALAAYSNFKAKYGPGVADLTLQQLVDQYPQDAQAVVASLGQVFPALAGKSFAQIWATIPDTFKQMDLGDLENAIPNSSWAGSATTTGIIPGISNKTAAIGGISLVLLAAIAFFALKKKPGGAHETV